MKKLVLIFLISFGCTQKKDEQKVVARVDQIDLTIDELKILYPENLIYQLNREQLTELLNDWANTQVFYLEAKKDRIDKEDSIRIHLDQLVRSTLAQTYVMREVQKVTVTQMEALDYFEKYRDDFLYAVKCLQIITPSELEAKQLLSEIKSGADFKKLVETRSSRPIEPRFYKKTELPPKFGEAIFRLKPGEITGIIRDEITKSYLIGKLLEKRRIKNKITFSEVSDYIYTMLRFNKQSRLYDSLMTEARKRHKIELYPERIR
ncbi:hypothetical protein DRP53_10050 [candidate division WOR-3 bacterium]|uniref:peptidylprolyl isomerase n=1 Tax=candidate division WOR-3 bacterium TaxID=2052148 RepID=A0A660SD91_UNCW3|nr:MAG: hypothetical protein DRP53_10050 [candidate division WOR-3 bacterium]